MPDYSACANTDCQKRHDCCRYRMVVEPDERQAFALMSGDGLTCELYWPVGKGAPFWLLDADAADVARAEDKAKFTHAFK